MREVVFVMEEGVINDLDTVLDTLKGHIAAKAESVSSGSKAHWTSAMHEAAIWCDKGGQVLVFLCQFHLPVPTQGISCGEVLGFRVHTSNSSERCGRRVGRAGNLAVQFGEVNSDAYS